MHSRLQHQVPPRRRLRRRPAPPSPRQPPLHRLRRRPAPPSPRRPPNLSSISSRGVERGENVRSIYPSLKQVCEDSSLYSELDAREHCKEVCVSNTDCGEGEYCWGTHGNVSEVRPNSLHSKGILTRSVFVLVLRFDRTKDLRKPDPVECLAAVRCHRGLRADILRCAMLLEQSV